MSVRLLESSNCAMYILTMSKDELMCLSDFLEEGFLSKSTAACEFGLLAVETNDKVVINPSNLDTGQKQKINLNFYFHTSL